MEAEVTLPFDAAWTKPLFLREAASLMKTLKIMDVEALARHMNVSNELAVHVKEQTQVWDRRHSLPVSGPALWRYRGDIYRGLRADNFDHAAATWTNEHLRIISGLYGLLRPFDLIQPYRLEMKVRDIGNEESLYDFWDDKLAGEAATVSNGIVCNLASDEYARAVLRHLDSNIRVVTPIFMDLKPDGSYGSVPIYSKIMRGVMARWIVLNRVNDPDKLALFSDEGYDYDVSLTNDSDHPVFMRDFPEPIRF